MKNRLLLPMVAVMAASGCAQFQTEGEPENQITDEVVTLSDWDYDDIYNRGGIRSSRLMGAEVFGPDGREIGNVENLIIGKNNQIVGLIAEVGGFIDIGDTHVAVPWEEVSLTNDGVRVPVKQENVSEYGLFGKKSPLSKSDLTKSVRVDDDANTGPQTWKLTSLIGDYATLTSGAGYGYVDEVLFSREGRIQAVMIERGGYPYAYPFYGDPWGWQPGLNAYPMMYGPADTGAIEPFDYELYRY